MILRSLPLCGLLAAMPFILFAQKPSVRVAVVGGGMAGISAAYHIQEADPSASITIFEKEKVVGGNARTVTVQNAHHENIQVDAGPQYFTEGPWNEYIEFLKVNDVYDDNKTHEFIGSISIQNEASKRPILITPLGSNFRGEKLAKLIRFKKFFDLAHGVYNKPFGSDKSDIGTWVKNMPIDLEFKQQVVLPFLAASLGTTVDDIKETSTADIVKLFAFRKPSNKGTFKVMEDGMGTLIQRVGAKLQEKGVKLMCDAPVKKVTMDNGRYTLEYIKGQETKQETFDFVVMAVHADIAHKILKDDEQFNTLAMLLKEFEYFKARIVIHSDPHLVNQKQPAFLNVLTTIDNQIAANTMNLGMIDKRYEGIYKSWLTEELATKLKINGHFMHEEIFWHPLITPKFNESLQKMNLETKKVKGLCFAGGWTQGLETQETAVISGKKAAEIFKNFNIETSDK